MISTQNLYVIFDLVAQAVVGAIMMLPNDAVARRTFQDALSNGKSILASHPADYALFHVGTVDVRTGAITGVEGGVESSQPIITGDVIVDLLNRQQESVTNG